MRLRNKNQENKPMGMGAANKNQENLPWAPKCAMGRIVQLDRGTWLCEKCLRSEGLGALMPVYETTSQNSSSLSECVRL